MLTYRHTTEADLPKLDEWVSADPIHKDIMTGSDFILKPDDRGMQCIEISDKDGVVFYMRLRNALIVETQFPPAGYSQLRVAKALKEAFGFFSVASKNLGYHAMFFQSVSDGLVSFFEKLGFKRLKDHFKAEL